MAKVVARKPVGEFSPPPDPLVEDIKTIVTERIYNSNIELVKCYWEVGIRLLEEKDVDKATSQVTDAIPQLSERTLQRCVQFARKYQTEEAVDNLPFGKKISWHLICNQLLPIPKEDGWSWRIIDATKVNPEFLSPDRGKIERQVKVMGKQAEQFIGGVEVFKE